MKISEFANVFTLKVGTTELEFNGYAYVLSVLGDANASEGVKNLAKGIYRYAKAAEEF